MMNLKKGFTLIELIIVIAIIAVLAIALISALDPLENIRRATDTKNKTAGRQLIDAIGRYYLVNGSAPWTSTTVPLPTIVTTLKTSSELKSSYVIPSNSTFTINSATGANATLCIDLKSKSAMQQGNYSDANGSVQCTVGSSPCQNADLNHDGVVDISDLGIIWSEWGRACTPQDQYCGDINGDGTVNQTDSDLFMAQFGQSCTAPPTSCQYYCMKTT
jgi:prepilin-type N-terminal cleavage/methylation domain-containing protein